MGINAQRAFQSDATNDNYLWQLNVDDGARNALRSARDLIREELKTGLRNWSDVVDKRVLFEAAALEARMIDGETILRPKFKMQGSWSYHTLNCTTFEPPQEIDLDDGMFLPVSFLSNNGATHPAIVSSSYFTAVEEVFAKLCEERGWTLVTDLPSCVRVKVRKGAHIDIALYAIPDDEFQQLVEKSEASFQSRELWDQEIVFAEDVYPQLPPDHIMLAHREQGWKPSDPRKLETWFQEAIDRHGYQLRRVCRYLKAWRDSRWEKCRLSSIALMACAVTAFDEASAAPQANRDDLAMSMVADRLPELLTGRIINPVLEGQFLDEKWDDSREEFVAAAIQLSTTLRNALTASNPEVARDRLVAEFGHYMPTNVAYYIAEVPGPTILSEGILGGFAGEETEREAIQLGGDDRYG